MERAKGVITRLSQRQTESAMKSKRIQKVQRKNDAKILFGDNKRDGQRQSMLKFTPSVSESIESDAEKSEISEPIDLIFEGSKQKDNSEAAQVDQAKIEGLQEAQSQMEPPPVIIEVRAQSQKAPSARISNASSNHTKNTNRYYCCNTEACGDKRFHSRWILHDKQKC